jgi:hypothetical protein
MRHSTGDPALARRGAFRAGEAARAIVRHASWSHRFPDVFELSREAASIIPMEGGGGARLDPPGA